MIINKAHTNILKSGYIGHHSKRLYVVYKYVCIESSPQERKISFSLQDEEGTLTSILRIISTYIFCVK
jgi:hypothetical protein